MNSRIEQIRAQISSIQSVLLERDSGKRITELNRRIAATHDILGIGQDIFLRDALATGPKSLKDSLVSNPGLMKQFRVGRKTEHARDLMSASKVRLTARLQEAEQELRALLEQEKPISHPASASSELETLREIEAGLKDGTFTQKEAAAFIASISENSPILAAFLSLRELTQDSSPAGATHKGGVAEATDTIHVESQTPEVAAAAVSEAPKSAEAGESKPAQAEIFFGPLTAREVGFLQTVFEHHGTDINGLLNRNDKSEIDDATVESVRTAIADLNLPSEEGDEKMGEEEQARIIRQSRIRALGKVRDLIRGSDFDRVHNAISVANGDVGNLLTMLKDIEDAQAEHPQLPGQLLQGISYLQVRIKLLGQTPALISGRAYAVKPSSEGRRVALHSPVRPPTETRQQSETAQELALKADAEARRRLADKRPQLRSGLPPKRAESAPTPAVSVPHPHLRLVLSRSATHAEPVQTVVGSDTTLAQAGGSEENGAQRRSRQERKAEDVATIRRRLEPMFEVLLAEGSACYEQVIKKQLANGFTDELVSIKQMIRYFPAQNRGLKDNSVFMYEQNGIIQADMKSGKFPLVNVSNAILAVYYADQGRRENTHNWDTVVRVADEIWEEYKAKFLAKRKAK
jgi:hypothetical protein